MRVVHTFLNSVFFFHLCREEKILSLARCPNPKCSKDPPIRRLAQLKNILTLAIRRHVKRFYSGMLTCEDPACEGTNTHS